MVKFKKQKEFPFIKKFKKKFPITEDTIFIYKDIIYTNNELPYDVLAHEVQHLKQMKRIGAKKWINKYLTNKKFRFNQEIEAYKIQMLMAKKTGDREEYNHILIECANNLSSGLYGKFNFEEVRALIKCW